MKQITAATGRDRAEALSRRWIDKCLWHLETTRATTDGFSHFNATEIAQMGEEPARELEAPAQPGGDLCRDQQKQTIRRAVAGGPQPDALQKIVDAAGQAMDVSVDRATPEGRLASNLFLRAFATPLDEAGDVLAPLPCHAPPTDGAPALPDCKRHPNPSGGAT